MSADRSVSMVFESTAPRELTNLETVPDLAGDAGSWQYFRLPVPAGRSSLRAELRGGAGNADLYVRSGELPTTSAFECAPDRINSVESCDFASPRGADWFIGVYGQTDFSGVQLTVSYFIDSVGFDIEIVFDPSTNGWSVLQRERVARGILRWASLIVDDVPGYWYDDSCNVDDGRFYVDDMIVYVREEDIDGEGKETPDGFRNTLASASACRSRVSHGSRDAIGHGALPFVGWIRFDAWDFDRFDGEALENLAAHEMGHVLGIANRIWGNPPFNFIAGPLEAPYHTGAETDRLYRLAFGLRENVPVEDTIRSHWDEEHFSNELMTPSASGGWSPLSAISLAALSDLGYRVDYEGADPFTFIPFPAAAGLEEESRKIRYYRDVVITPPIPLTPSNRPRRRGRDR